MSPRRPEERPRQQLVLSADATAAPRPVAVASSGCAAPLGGGLEADAAGRDYRAERERRLRKAANRMVFLRERREEEWRSGFALIAQATILTALPLRPTNEKQIARKARLGDGSSLTVTFAAVGDGAVMPYGADVTLLYFLFDRAISAQSPIFEWKYAADYFSFIGVNADAGKNFVDLRARWRRILALAVRIERTTLRGEEQGMGLFLIEQYRLPASIASQRGSRAQLSLPGVDYGLKLNETYWRDAMTHHVPVPKDLIRETRDELLLQRLAIFLGWRCYAAARALKYGETGESVIPWPDVRSLVGSEMAAPKRFRQEVRYALTALRVLWPELRVEARPAGLWIAPPSGNVQLLPDGEGFRRQ
jgi:hypothetical protein